MGGCIIPSSLWPAMVLVGTCACVTNSSALTIIRDFIGGEPATNNVGSGNLVDTFNAAADIWERAILDDHTVVLHYGWAPNGGAEHFLIAQGGTPNREIEGQILFNNDGLPGHYAWYLDPTPSLNEEFSNYREAAQDIGCGIINVSRIFQDRLIYPDAFDKYDLLTTALHEIGHALGISAANISYITETTADANINITIPRPFPGMSIPVVPTAAHIHYDLAACVLMASGGTVGRIMPSALDVLAEAQISDFRRLNLALSPELSIHQSGQSAILSWPEAIPGFALEHHTNLASVDPWLPITEPVHATNGLFTVSRSITGQLGFMRLRRTNDFALEVSAISQDPPDADPDAPGVQTHAGSTVQYSVSTRQPAGTTIYWYWTYALNGGTPVLAASGTGPVDPVTFTYGHSESGNTYSWTLNVSTEITATARLSVIVTP